jgi:hypothetical protein
MQRCNFKDSILFSDVAVDGDFRRAPIEPIKSVAEYQIFRLRKLPLLVHTPFVLFIEWDGYVVEPRAWHAQFLKFDYIGARWPQYSDKHDVGNSGFCLLSQKLLKALLDTRFTPKVDLAVDTLICRSYRPTLEREFGIRFAPGSIADLFSYENHLPDLPTFGFHGCGNMWRHTEDKEMVELVAQLNPYVFETPHFALLIVRYALMRKFFPLEQIYRKMRLHLTSIRVQQLIRTVAPISTADFVFSMCERLIE